MNERLQRIKATLEIEFDVSFPFPSAEILFLVLYILTTSSIFLGISYVGAVVAPHPPQVNPLILDPIMWTFQHADFNLLKQSLYNMNLLITIAIPMLSAFRVAGPIESGLLKTILTYPIRRRDLLILKGVEILVCTALPITIGALMGVILFQWQSIGLDSLVLLFSFWVMAFTVLSTSIFLSLATRSMANSAFGGIAIWVTFYLVAAVTHIPNIFRGILNPVNLVLSYFGETSGASLFGFPFENLVVYDVWGAIIINLLIGFFIFLLSIKLFRRMEV